MVKREHKYTEHNSRKQVAPSRGLRVLTDGQSPGWGNLGAEAASYCPSIHPQKIRFLGTKIGSGTQPQAVKKKNCIPGKRK